MDTIRILIWGYRYRDKDTDTEAGYPIVLRRAIPVAKAKGYDGLSPSLKYNRTDRGYWLSRGRAEVARQAKNLGLTFRG